MISEFEFLKSNHEQIQKLAATIVTFHAVYMIQEMLICKSLNKILTMMRT